MMKHLIFALLFISSILYAEQDQRCYSVQLSSYLQKNENYQSSIQYPAECKRFSFGNMKAIRCGCYPTKEQAKSRLAILKKKYTRPIVVRTTQSRYNLAVSLRKSQTLTKKEFTLHSDKDKKNKEEKAQDPSTLSDTGFDLKESDSFVSTDEDADYHGYEDIPTALKIQYYIYESELSIQGHIDVTAQTYPIRPEGKNKNNLTASGQLELGFKKDDFEAIANIYVQGDSHDMKGSSEQNNRSYLRLDEFYGKYEFENSQIMAGKSLRFGVL